MKIELKSIPSTQTDRIDAFVSGANEVLKHVPNSSGNEPMCIDVDFRSTGNCHINLLIGQWVGAHKAEF
jgi:hypothetical protein